jgi:hypothetical protein
VSSRPEITASDAGLVNSKKTCVSIQFLATAEGYGQPRAEMNVQPDAAGIEANVPLILPVPSCAQFLLARCKVCWNKI